MATYKASTVVAVAKNEVGYLEKKSNKSLDSKTANAGSKNYTKYGKWIGANGDYWCASFLSWLFMTAFGSDNGKKLLCGSFSAACETIRNAFIKKGQYHTSSPKVGDVIFFSGSRHNGANHIGLVYAMSGGIVYTIEGNTSGGSSVVDNGGGVAKKSYSTSNSRILGYGRPAYTKVATATVTYTTVKLTTSRASIKWMQTRLNACYTGKLAKLDTDGIWGTKTWSMLRAYWKQLGWSTKGAYAGKATCKALKSGRKK